MPMPSRSAIRIPTITLRQERRHERPIMLKSMALAEAPLCPAKLDRDVSGRAGLRDLA